MMPMQSLLQYLMQMQRPQPQQNSLGSIFGGVGGLATHAAGLGGLAGPIVNAAMQPRPNLPGIAGGVAGNVLGHIPQIGAGVAGLFNKPGMSGSMGPGLGSGMPPPPANPYGGLGFPAKPSDGSNFTPPNNPASFL